MTPAARALLETVIDYAGLFPPAALPMREAAARYAEARRGPHAWMAGRFVVPAGRLDELGTIVASQGHAGPGAAWPLSVLVDPGAPDDLSAAAAAIAAGPSRGLAVQALESKVETASGVEDAARRLPRGAEWWFEVAPGPAVGSTLSAIHDVAGGAKLRMGGLVAKAFPSTADTARLILACAAADVSWKATAGLHHAVAGRYRVTGADDSPKVAMHGLLNVLLAGALAQALRRQGCPDPEAHAQVVALLEESDPRAFGWSESGVGWRTYRFAPFALAASRRTGARSIGSCSFDEPIQELVTLGILSARASADG